MYGLGLDLQPHLSSSQSCPMQHPGTSNTPSPLLFLAMFHVCLWAVHLTPGSFLLLLQSPLCGFACFCHLCVLGNSHFTLLQHMSYQELSQGAVTCDLFTPPF